MGGQLPLEEALASVAVLCNAHLAQNATNGLAVLAASPSGR
jgi:hypothetical protein